MLICDVCKKNKATRKITYPTMDFVEEIQPYGIDAWRTIRKQKRENTEYDICQQCWDIIAINRDYVFRMTKEMIELEENEE